MSNESSVKPKKISLEQTMNVFESKIQELSGNKQFQMNTLSPEIQGIIKRYILNKARDNWDELGSCFDPTAQQQEGMVIRRAAALIPNQISNSCEPKCDVSLIQQNLFDALHIKKIVHPMRILRNEFSRKDAKMGKNNQVEIMTTPIIYKPVIHVQGKNLPPIFKQVKLRVIETGSQTTFQQKDSKNTDNTTDISKLTEQITRETSNRIESIYIPRSKKLDISNSLSCQKYSIRRPDTYYQDQNNTQGQLRYPPLEFSPTRIYPNNAFYNSPKFREDENEDIQDKKKNIQKTQFNPRKTQTYLTKQEQQIEDLLPILKDPRFVKDRQFQLKYAAYREQLNVVNSCNSLFVHTPSPSYFPIYKCFIGRGNNGMLVRQIIKQRWWWGCVENKEEIDGINLMWTQSKNTLFIESFKTLKGKNKEDDQVAHQSDQESYNSDFSENEGTKGNIFKINTKNRNLNKSSNIEENTNDQNKYKKIFGNHKQKVVNILTSGKLTVLNEQSVRNLCGSQLQIYQDPSQMKIHNHLEFHFHLSNKKALFYNMRSYYESQKQNVFNYLPLTFHIKGSDDNEEFKRFLEAFTKRAEEEVISDKKIKNIWIVKPGENSNRGNGIRVCSTIAEVKELQSGLTKESNNRTLIVQQYLDKPLLYQKRKFDIRCFVAISSINGYLKAYWYSEGYIRTSSKEFNVKNLANRMVHLTNDAVQKKGDQYGRYERGNKISFEELNKYLQSSYLNQVDFFIDIYPQMKSLTRDCIRAVYSKIDTFKRENTFEIFGMDFMIDENFKVWLIEVNTNPCLETTSPILFKIIPSMLDNAFKLFLDPVFPAPHFFSQKKMVYESILENNKFELIFDEISDGPQLSCRNFDQQNDFNIKEIAEDIEEDVSDGEDYAD